MILYEFLQQVLVGWAMNERDRIPAVKKKKPYWPTWPRHLRRTASVQRTRQHIPIPERAKPFAKRRSAYIQTFGEREVMKVVVKVKMNASSNVFFLPKHASARRP